MLWGQQFLQACVFAFVMEPPGRLRHCHLYLKPQTSQHEARLLSPERPQVLTQAGSPGQCVPRTSQQSGGG